LDWETVQWDEGRLVEKEEDQLLFEDLHRRIAVDISSEYSARFRHQINTVHKLRNSGLSLLRAFSNTTTVPALRPNLYHFAKVLVQCTTDFHQCLDSALTQRHKIDQSRTQNPGLWRSFLRSIWGGQEAGDNSVEEALYEAEKETERLVEMIEKRQFGEAGQTKEFNEEVQVAAEKLRSGQWKRTK